jgi:hypothetical protein
MSKLVTKNIVKTFNVKLSDIIRNLERALYDEIIVRHESTDESLEEEMLGWIHDLANFFHYVKNYESMLNACENGYACHLFGGVSDINFGFDIYEHMAQYKHFIIIVKDDNDDILWMITSNQCKTCED